MKKQTIIPTLMLAVTLFSYLNRTISVAEYVVSFRPLLLLTTIATFLFTIRNKWGWGIVAMGILLNWSIILLAAYFSTIYLNPLTYLLAILIIGARMHALAILMHDAAHFRFLKNRKWNDLLTDVTTMYPLFLTIEKYRTNHLEHHKHLNTEEDPDWVWFVSLP